MTTIRQAIESTFRQFIAPDIIGIKNDLAAIQNTLNQIIKNTAVTNVAKSLIDARDSVVNVSVGAVNVAPNITQKLEADVTVNVKLPEGLVDVLGDLKISLEGKLSTIETLLQGIKSCIGELKTDFKTYFEKNMPSILDVLHQIKVCVCEARSKDCKPCDGKGERGEDSKLSKFGSFASISAFLLQAIDLAINLRKLKLPKIKLPKIGGGALGKVLTKLAPIAARLGPIFSAIGLNILQFGPVLGIVRSAFMGLGPLVARLIPFAARLGPIFSMIGLNMLQYGRVMGLVRSGAMVLGPVLNVLRVGLMAVGGVLAGVSLPVLALIAAIVAVIAIFVLFWDEIKAFFLKFEFVRNTVDILKKAFESIIDAIIGLLLKIPGGRKLLAFLADRKQKKEEDAAGETGAKNANNLKLPDFGGNADGNDFIQGFMANPQGPAPASPSTVSRFGNSRNAMSNTANIQTQVTVNNGQNSQSPESIGRGIGKGINKSLVASDIYYATAEPRFG